MFLKEFSDRGWTRGGLNYLLSKIDNTGSFHRQSGSGRPRTARTTNNVDHVESQVLSGRHAANASHTETNSSRTKNQPIIS